MRTREPAALSLVQRCLLLLPCLCLCHFCLKLRLLLPPHQKQGERTLDRMLCERNQRLRARFPDFVYAWFEPPLHALAAAESGEAREAMMADADEDRWGLYYGVKALSRELPEARLFYNFLDEKYGEDELTFSSSSFALSMASKPSVNALSRLCMLLAIFWWKSDTSESMFFISF